MSTLWLEGPHEDGQLMLRLHQAARTSAFWALKQPHSHSTPWPISAARMVCGAGSSADLLPLTPSIQWDTGLRLDYCFYPSFSPITTTAAVSTDSSVLVKS